MAGVPAHPSGARERPRVRMAVDGDGGRLVLHRAPADQDGHPLGALGNVVMGSGTWRWPWAWWASSWATPRRESTRSSPGPSTSPSWWCCCSPPTTCCAPSPRARTDLYVSLWYIMGSLIWFPIVFAIGNVIWAPPTGSLIGPQRRHLGVVLRPQHPRSLVHDRHCRARLLHRPQGDQTAAIRLLAGADRLLVPRVLLHRRGDPPHPAVAGARVAQDDLGDLVDGHAHPRVRLHHQRLHDLARIVERPALLHPPALRGDRRGLLPAHQHPRLHAGVARLQRVHPFHELYGGPCPHGAVGIRGLHAVGRRVLHLPEDQRGWAVLRAAGLDPLVADVRGLPRVLLGTDRRPAWSRPAASRRASRPSPSCRRSAACG